jgi:hypothetical protein
LYDELDYGMDMATQNMQKGRWKKKHFPNEMDDTDKGYHNDMYGSNDFDKIKNKVHCSIYHGEGQTMDRDKDGLKRNRRMYGAMGRNCRSGITYIIEVSHMYCS